MIHAPRWRELLQDGAEEIRAVLFDAVGTLIFADPPVHAVYGDLGRRHGSRRTVAEVARRLPPAMAAGRSPDGGTNEVNEREFWRGVVGGVFDDVRDAETLFAELWTHFAAPSSWRIAHGAQELIGRLNADGFVVGVASNFDARLHAVLRGRLDGATVFVSSELGWQKPHREFFRAIEARLGRSPRELLLVGDDWENDVLGAQRAGWRAIWINDSADATDVPRARSLDELRLR